MILHKGEIIKNAVKETSFSISLLAKRMGKSRQHIYDIFENPSVPIDTILLIGKIIQFDFEDNIKEISNIPSEYKQKVMSEIDVTCKDVTYWKNKYFELMEEHKYLMKNKMEEFFNTKK